MSAAVRIARPDEHNRVVIAYRAWGYRAGIAPRDTIWLAETSDELIGAVRIVTEGGTLVLRGMRIAENWRRRGIGSQMLHMIDAWLGERQCYCVPYSHLTTFYLQAGFIEKAPAAVPPFLATRLEEYRGRRLDVIIMARAV